MNIFNITVKNIYIYYKMKLLKCINNDKLCIFNIYLLFRKLKL